MYTKAPACPNRRLESQRQEQWRVWCPAMEGQHLPPIADLFPSSTHILKRLRHLDVRGRIPPAGEMGRCTFASSDDPAANSSSSAFHRAAPKRNLLTRLRRRTCTLLAPTLHDSSVSSPLLELPRSPTLSSSPQTHLASSSSHPLQSPDNTPLSYPRSRPCSTHKLRASQPGSA